jgi:hypothetical protein
VSGPKVPGSPGYCRGLSGVFNTRDLCFIYMDAGHYPYNNCTLSNNNLNNGNNPFRQAVSPVGGLRSIDKHGLLLFGRFLLGMSGLPHLLEVCRGSLWRKRTRAMSGTDRQLYEIAPQATANVQIYQCADWRDHIFACWAVYRSCT